jgi:hypothetical protein
LEGELGQLARAVGLVKVDETKWEPLWDKLARERHYLAAQSAAG